LIKLILLGIAALLLWRWFTAPRRPSEADARRLLELGPDPDAAAVAQAHRRLLHRVHPDAGGSAELTRRVNEARDILLAAHNRRRG
jgi:DnaJ homolog subfamily C member 19